MDRRIRCCTSYYAAARSELSNIPPPPHAGAESFYDAEGIAQWIMARYPTTRTVFLKHRANQGAAGGGGQQGAGEERGRVLRGAPPAAGEPVRFVENGVAFQADIVQGQKTGGCVCRVPWLGAGGWYVSSNRQQHESGTKLWGRRDAKAVNTWVESWMAAE